MVEAGDEVILVACKSWFSIKSRNLLRINVWINDLPVAPSAFISLLTLLGRSSNRSFSWNWRESSQTFVCCRMSFDIGIKKSSGAREGEG